MVATSRDGGNLRAWQPGLAPPETPHPGRRRLAADVLRRNLLMIPAGSELSASLDSKVDRKSARDELIARLIDDSVMDLLAVCAQHCERNPFRQDLILMLEIFDEIFSAFRPAELLSAEGQLLPVPCSWRPCSVLRSWLCRGRCFGRGFSNRLYPPFFSNPAEEMRRHGLSLENRRRRDDAAARSVLQQAKHAEQQPLSQRLAGLSMTRHARFGGMVLRQGAVGAAMALSTTTTRAFHSDTLRPMVAQVSGKGGRKAALTGAAAGTTSSGPAAATRMDILARVKQQADRFLDEGSYDVLMSQLKREVMRGVGMSKLERLDVIRFLNLARFFTEFLRRRVERGAARSGDDSASPFGHITATMGFDMFKEVFEMWSLEADKPVSVEDKDWDLQHAACGLYKEMLFSLEAAVKHGTPSDQRAANRMQSKILHNNLKDSGLVPLIARSIKGYDWRKEGVAHAPALVEMVHVILKTLDRLAEGGLLVKVRAHGGGGRRKKAPEQEQPEEPGQKEEAGEEPQPQRKVVGLEDDDDEAEGEAGAAPQQRQQDLAARETQSTHQDNLMSPEGQTPAHKDTAGGCSPPTASTAAARPVVGTPGHELPVSLSAFRLQEEKRRRRRRRRPLRAQRQRRRRRASPSAWPPVGTRWSSWTMVTRRMKRTVRGRSSWTCPSSFASTWRTRTCLRSTPRCSSNTVPIRAT